MLIGIEIQVAQMTARRNVWLVGKLAVFEDVGEDRLFVEGGFEECLMYKHESCIN